jgi:hypothetical protein
VPRLCVAGWGSRSGPSPSTPLVVGASFREAVIARLLADTTLTAIVGTRVTPVRRPQRGPLPALVVTITSAPRGQNLLGPDGTVKAQVMFEAFALTQATASKIINAVRLDFNGFTGLLSAQVSIMETHLDDESDSYVAANDGSDAGTYVLSLDFTIRFREATT